MIAKHGNPVSNLQSSKFYVEPNVKLMVRKLKTADCCTIGGFYVLVHSPYDCDQPGAVHASGMAEPACVETRHHRADTNTRLDLGAVSTHYWLQDVNDPPPAYTEH